jgi:hypothetical protein
MSINKKIATVVASIALASVALTGCTTDRDNREAAQKAATSKSGESLELKNLKEKRNREEDPNSIRYLYVMNFGKIVGYYVTKGKISSNGSQIGPETEIINGGGNGNVVDSAQDDGSYGAGDPGIFFFTTDNVMVVTSLDYIQSDQPLAVDVPRLSK